LGFQEVVLLGRNITYVLKTDVWYAYHAIVISDPKIQWFIASKKFLSAHGDVLDERYSLGMIPSWYWGYSL
jgi:hypothetical protein